MYNPERYKNTDTDSAFKLMTQFPLATVISINNEQPFISHLPLTLVQENGKIILIGHMAKANPHWKLMDQQQVTAVFQGNNTYITPKWYAENDVPTWNYSVVHTKGTAEIYEKFDDLVDCLQVLTKHTETVWPSGWEFFIPDDLPKPVLEKSIVGFKITVEDLVFKSKLSQNRSDDDRKGILAGLAARGDGQSLGVLKDMQELYTQGGRKK